MALVPLGRPLLVAPEMSAPAEAGTLSGDELRGLFCAAATWLEHHVEQVNALNVFPVPDGDTGTNMFLTMRSTVQEADRCRDTSAGAVLAAMSHGALMGARGNSGVILSQIIGGLARATAGEEAIDAARLVAGMEEGSAAAYQGVTTPAEGTILTVIRDASVAARAHLESGDPGIGAILEAAVEGARESVQRTPALLPVLAEAGVVDAGGLGLSLLLEGMLRSLRGEPLDAPDPATQGAVSTNWLAVTEQRHATQDSLYGYCTEVLVASRGLDGDAMRNRINTLGDSVLVVGDDRLLRVHVHTDDPGLVLSHGTSVGSLLQVKVDNIRSQAEQFLQMHEDRTAVPGSAEPGGLSSVAVVAGEGMAAVFRSVGCTRTISGGPTMSPSTQEILDAVEGCPAHDVLVLPNDKNIILAAQQAAGLTEKRLHVVSTRSMPQGLAVLLAVNPEDSIETAVEAAEEARTLVRTVEITRAVRNTTIKGVKVGRGEAIAIVDGELTLGADSTEDAVLDALRDVATAETSLITLYYGASTGESQAASLAVKLRDRFPAHEVEVVYGGQPHYQYIVSVE